MTIPHLHGTSSQLSLFNKGFHRLTFTWSDVNAKDTTEPHKLDVASSDISCISIVAREMFRVNQPEGLGQCKGSPRRGFISSNCFELKTYVSEAVSGDTSYMQVHTD